MTVIELLRYGSYVTLDDIRMMTGLPERAVRKEIERLRRQYPIINLQDGRGYRLTYKDKAALEAFIRQEEHRAKRIFWRCKGCKDALKDIEFLENKKGD